MYDKMNMRIRRQTAQERIVISFPRAFRKSHKAAEKGLLILRTIHFSPQHNMFVIVTTTILTESIT